MFKRLFSIYILLLTIIIPTNNSWALMKEENYPVINILSPPETSLVISELIRIYSRTNNINFLANFDDTNDLIDNVEAGDPADLIITSHQNSRKILKQKGLIDFTSTSELFYDKLVFIAANSEVKFPRFANIQDYPKYKFIFPTLKNNLALYLEEIVVKDPMVSKLTDIQFVRTDGSADKLLVSNPHFFSINFYSSIYDNQKYKIIGEVDNSTTDNISYNASIIASENSANVEKFLDFLKSSEAQTIYLKYGFKVND